MGGEVSIIWRKVMSARLDTQMALDFCSRLLALAFKISNERI